MDERGQPAYDAEPLPIAPGADPRRLYVVIWLLVGIIVLLVVRPWGDETVRPTAVDAAGSRTPDGSRTPEGPGTTGSAAGAASPAPADPYADLWVTCGSPSGWRAATLQAWAGRQTPIRSWIAIDPVEGTGPLDPGIPFAPVATGVVTAIGYCSPQDERLRPPRSAVAAVWAIRDGLATRLTLGLIEPQRPNALGGLWVRAPEAGGGSAWPPGRYVIEVASPSGTFDRWLGIEIEDLSRPRSPSASPSPGASHLPPPSTPAS